MSALALIGLVLKYPILSTRPPHTLDIFQEDNSDHFGIHPIGISGQDTTASSLTMIRPCGLAHVLALPSPSTPVRHLHFSYTPISAARS